MRLCHSQRQRRTHQETAQVSGAPGDDIELRIQVIGEREAALITSPDPQLRFHSGLPEKNIVIQGATFLNPLRVGQP